MEGKQKKYVELETNPNFYLDHIRFSCFSNKLLSGYDNQGGIDDLTFFDETPTCDIYECIRTIETLKHSINNTFLNHVSLAANIFSQNKNILEMLGVYNLMHLDFDTWKEKAKTFYLAVLTKNYIYDKMNICGVIIEEIETALDLIFQLEEYNNIKNTETRLN